MNSQRKSGRHLSLRQEVVIAVALAVAVYAAMNWIYLWNLTSGIQNRSPIKTFGQLSIFLIGFLSTIAILSITSPVKYIFAVMFVFSVSANYCAFDIVGVPPKRQIGVWLYSEIAQSFNAMQEWWQIILKMTACGIAVVLALTLISSRLGSNLRHKLPSVSYRITIFTLICFSIALPLIGGFLDFPMGLAESDSYSYLISFLRIRSVKPELPEFSIPSIDSAPEKIVLVVDESIRPDEFEKSFYWPSPSTVINYGDGYSTGNCSAASNSMLRWGVTKDEIGRRHDPRGNTNIWLYAKHAGFRTILIDGQVSSPGRTQDFMGYQELMSIDRMIAADIGVDTDDRVAIQLRDILSEPGRDFIYVVKRGAHVPYQRNLPDEMASSGMPIGTLYQMAVDYSTGRFFRSLYSGISNFKPYMIFYTSDHGQNIGVLPAHCSGEYQDEEFRVPVVVIGNFDKLMSEFRICAHLWNNRVNHQSLRSSVIEAMGYDVSDIDRKWFEPLGSCNVPKEIPRLHTQLPFLSASDDVVDIRMVKTGALK